MTDQIIMTDLLAAASFPIPLWGVPILLAAGLGARYYQRKRDQNR